MAASVLLQAVAQNLLVALVLSWAATQCEMQSVTDLGDQENACAQKVNVFMMVLVCRRQRCSSRKLYLLL